MEFLSYFLLLLSPILTVIANAQTTLISEVVSTFIFTRYGDRTPLALPQTPELTSLGAQQLYAAGSNFRERYILGDATSNISTNIRGISYQELSNDEITVLSTNDQYVSASAQAFMQGLYPPVIPGSNYANLTGDAALANGTVITGPFGGYQYANIETLSSNDLNYIWLSGASNCPVFAASNAAYYNSPGFEALQQSTSSFYTGLEPQFLNGVFTNASVGYFDSYYIWDYLNYENIHSSTVAQSLAPEDLTKAKILADDWVMALNANTTSPDTSGSQNIAVIAGRTLAARILQAFYTTIDTQGQSDKMTLFFGSFEPMVSFAALAGLIAPQNAAFQSIPAEGSSFVFELFALRQNDVGTYPTTDELFVRFLYQNGTDADATLIAYPLFGQSPSEIVLSLSDFIAGLQRFMIFNIEDWCTTCSSYSIFCPAFENGNNALNPETKSSKHGKVSPAVAGVIGAVVTIVVFGLILAALMLLAGFRLQKIHTKRRSELGGFKGAEKLASDQDLTLPGGAGGVVAAGTRAGPPRGHERVGSWELSEQAKAEEAQRSSMAIRATQMRRPSYEDDELHVNSFAAPVKPHDHV